MKKIDELIIELMKFSNKILTVNPPLSNLNSVAIFEKKHNIVLPDDYKYLLKRCNGFDLMGVTVYGFNEDNESIVNVYDFEHFEVESPQFSYLVPFSPDGGGNYYCFDTSKLSNDSCKIVFWESN